MSNVEIKKHIQPREREAIIQSLRAGVTPRTGLQHVLVGRVKEIDALDKDLKKISEGSSVFRIVFGDFGAGKSFFLQVVRYMALQKGLVTMHADLSPDRRLQSSGGQAKNLFVELMCNLSTRTKPEGNAISSVVERFITEARKQADSSGMTTTSIIENKLSHLSELVGGYDFARVIAKYWDGHEQGNEQLKIDAVRWLRGEVETKTDARKALDVRTTVEDDNVYDRLKLMSLFVKQAGYGGLLINLDEMVNLYKLSSQKSRISNYEKILLILNDCLQGSAKHIGFILSGTSEFLRDTRKGLYSYEALHSRLAENSFANAAGVIDYSSPALHLSSLLPEDLYALMKKLRDVFACGDSSKYLVPDEALKSFLEHCLKKVGDAYFRTPRNTIKAFVDLLTVLEQNPCMQWTQLINQTSIEKEKNSDMPQIGENNVEKDDGDTGRSRGDGELETFQL